MNNTKHICKLVDDLYWDYDRLSTSGQETLDKLAKTLGLPTNEEVNKMSRDKLDNVLSEKCGWDEIVPGWND